MEQTIRKRPNTMANMALVFGILSVLSAISIYFTYLCFFFGCMSILFAHFSKGDGFKMNERAVGGMAASIFAMVIAALLLAAGLYFSIRLFGLETLLDPEALQKALTDLYSNLSTQIPTGGSSL